MTHVTHALLVELTERYERTGEPVTAQELVASLAASEAAVDQSLDSLREFELVAVTGNGYRPTVTARELLELDAEFDDVLILEFVDGAESRSGGE